MKYKCPACGYQPDKQLAMKQTVEIYKNFSKDIQKDLKKIIQDVNRILFANQMPVEKKYRFLYSISPCNEEDIEYGIRTWNLKKMATSGKSLEYLSAIIRGRGETKEITAKAGYHGTGPLFGFGRYSPEPFCCYAKTDCIERLGIRLSIAAPRECQSVVSGSAG